MCGGPVGDKQSYWGLIQVKISGTQMPENELDEFKSKLVAFLSNHAQTGLPVNATAALANGAIKADDLEDGTSIQLVNRRP
jgi:hypothetical protein